MSGAAILVVNAGSTSVKVDLVGADESCRRLDSVAAAEPAEVAAVAHRVVHGGELRRPVRIDAAVEERIRAAEQLAPLHNRPALREIERARAALPGLPEVAVFDTGFHATIPAAAAAYALPRRWREEWGVRRYGFHGLSVQWSAERAPALLGRSAAGLRLVVCHLGGGSSVSAVRDGRSLDTTMGFSPLEGVPMATRSGSVDPGVLLYLLRERRLDREELERALESEAGLAALSGGSGDMREVERAAAAGEERAELALEVYAHRVAAAVAAMAAAAGGLDALVFTAGIGEGSAAVRERVCARLGFLGVELDRDRNAAPPDTPPPDAPPSGAAPSGAPPSDAAPSGEADAAAARGEAGPSAADRDLAAAGSPARVLVIAAREELVAARAVRRLLASPTSV